jgi:hypothetical protein
VWLLDKSTVMIVFIATDAGQWQAKYLLVLTNTPDSDVVFRLLTSQAHGRPEQPPCYHGHPYPSFYLGYLGDALTAKSWLDLRRLNDYDGLSFAADLTHRDLSLVATLPEEILCLALDCAANADDTTRQQERLIRDQRAALRCFITKDTTMPELDFKGKEFVYNHHLAIPHRPLIPHR